MYICICGIYRRKRFLDRDLPDKLDLYLPESRIYSQLVSFEHRLDSAIAKCLVEIQESSMHAHTNAQLIRIFLSHSHNNQAATTFTLSKSGGTASALSASTDPPNIIFKLQAALIDQNTGKLSITKLMELC